MPSSARFGSATAVFAGDPGSSSIDALPINGQSQLIQPQSSLWFYFDYSGDKTKIEAWVDDHLNSDPANAEIAKNVELFIYTPTQAQRLVSGQRHPADRARQQTAGWAGYFGTRSLLERQFQFRRSLFRRRQEQQQIPIQFKLWVKGDSVKLYPMPTPTSLYPYLDNPFATPIPSANITGTFVFQESSGGNIYTMTGDGTTLKKITTGLDPSWSPDGKMIAFTRWDEPTGLYVANADGTNPVRVWNGRSSNRRAGIRMASALRFAGKGPVETAELFWEPVFQFGAGYQMEARRGGIEQADRSGHDEERADRAAVHQSLLCAGVESGWTLYRLCGRGGRAA